jgi:hypothetical protein
MVAILKALISRFFKAFLQAFLSLLVGKLSTTVLQIVQDINGEIDWTDEQKRKEAFARIKQIVISSGLEIKDSTINLALEIAVSIWKDLKV